MPTEITTSDSDAIRIRGARTHNLRDVDLNIPRDRLVVLTGVSGSGKSSLAFDTLYAEGQRRFIESLSSYARQFLDQLERPDVDAIDGLPPTVSIDQKTGTANPRSTVGTLTEILDYLRILYARAGVPHCPSCGAVIRRQTPEQMVERVLAMTDGQKVVVLAPLVRGRKGEHTEALATIRREGLIRARIDGAMTEIDAAPKLARNKTHDIEAVVDRLVVREGIRPRLAESIDRALALGDGTVILAIQSGADWEDLVLSVNFSCPACGSGIAEIEPRTFSFNSPYGACPNCEGLGSVTSFDESLMLDGPARSLNEVWRELGAALKTTGFASIRNDPALTDLMNRSQVDESIPLKRWPKVARKALWNGDANYAGLAKRLEELRRNATRDSLRESLDTFRAATPCPECGGSRIRAEGRAVRVDGVSMPEFNALPIHAAMARLDTIHFETAMQQVGPPLAKEIHGRLAYLERVGLGYLTLDRAADTLSGGELQRVRLATQIGSGLVGVAFILDEPTAGLHPRDTGRLLDSLTGLRDAGNSLIVVEHDEATIRAADWIVDLGPGAGPDGGRIVGEGTLDDLIASPESATGAHFAKDARPVEKPRRRPTGGNALTIVGAREHNLKGDEARIPLGAFTCVSGVSGSGKSSLILDVLARRVSRAIDGGGPRPGEHDRIDGLEYLDKIIVIDQSPIGRTPRSTPATYTGLFDEIRKVYAQTREAKVRGYKANRFSFNVKGGRCETCQGQGQRRIAMQFLPDLFVRCESCGGKRFNPQTLEARFKGRSIGDALDLRVDEALDLFGAIPRVRRGLDALQEAGLGYMTLGQSSTTLSGGEAQRIKLAAELSRAETGKTLFILDEPTTGLHFADVANLLRILDRLVDLGNTVVVIEHNLDVIASADWVIDLGPEAGDAGGKVVAMGTPEAIAQSSESRTGPYLREILDNE
jgi:excinuclease ABC subunit A